VKLKINLSKIMSFIFPALITHPAETARNWISERTPSPILKIISEVVLTVDCLRSKMQPSIDHTRTITLPKDSQSCFNYYQYCELNNKTGLTARQYQSVKEYIETNIDGWEKALSKTAKNRSRTIRITKEESGLPVTIHAVKDKGKFFVWAICDKFLGSGSQKEVKHAFEYLSGTRWAYSETEGKSIQEESTVLADLAKPEERLKDIQKSAFIPLVGQTKYEGKTGCFTPLMDGNLRDTITRYKLNDSQRIEIMDELIDQLYLLAEKGIEHGDIKPENILCKVDGDSIRAYIIDHGSCVYHSKKKVRNKSRFLAGNKYYDSPEKRRYFEALVIGKTSIETLKKMCKETWTKHDVWSMGEVLDLLFEKTAERRKVTIYSKGTAYDKVCKTWERAMQEDFYDATFDTKTPMSEPSKKSVYHFVWRMKHYRPWERPSAKELYHDFQQFKVLSTKNHRVVS
jgi:serine/threonine protein kinase